MKNFLLIFALLLSGCTAIYTPLKGDYPEKIIWKETLLSFDESFDRIVEYLTESGSEVQNIDRQNGIIRLYGNIPSRKITLEKNGKAGNQKQYVVISQNKSLFYSLKSTVIVLVRPLGEGSKIGVRLIPKPEDTVGSFVNADVATLGNLETELLEAITKTK